MSLFHAMCGNPQTAGKRFNSELLPYINRALTEMGYDLVHTGAGGAFYQELGYTKKEEPPIEIDSFFSAPLLVRVFDPAKKEILKKLEERIAAQQAAEANANLQTVSPNR